MRRIYVFATDILGACLYSIRKISLTLGNKRGIGITERMPLTRGNKLIIAAWSIGLLVGLTILWLYFR